MAIESKLQTEIVRFLKKSGCYVIVTTPGRGVPLGCPDIIFFIEGAYGCIECKASEKASFQPLQRETIAKMDSWSYGRIVYPENWPEIKKELVDFIG